MGANWRRVKDRLEEEIATGRFAEGQRVPTEGEISQEYGVGRHSVRRAIAALAAEGLLSVEQGRGTFVRHAPRILYRIGRRTRFRENLRSQGLTPGGELISNAIVPAPSSVAAALALAEGTPVHRSLRRGLANGIPISLSMSFHSVHRFPNLPELRGEGRSLTEVYKLFGIEEYVRRDTMLYARLPEGTEARLLEQRPDHPVMVQCKTDTTCDGTPIGHSEGIWCATRVRFSLEADTNGDRDA